MRRLLLLSVLLLGATPSAAGAVVGGTTASQPYPWMTAVEVDGSFVCGGTLVAPQLVLTAAHCVVDDENRAREPRSFRVLVGAMRRSQRTTGDDRGVTRVERHESYSSSDGLKHDVALLTLDSPSGRAPIALAVDGDRPAWQPGRPVRALGWGTQSGLDPVGLTVTDELREVDLPVISDDACREDYGTSFDPAVAVCAGEEDGGRDTCQGDSGGPLLVSVGGGVLRQVGVVSFGTSCGLPGAPGVYARVGEGALRAWVSARLPAASMTPPPPAPPAADPAPPPAETAAGCVAARLRMTTSGLPGLRLGRRQNGNGSRCVEGGGRVELRARRKRLALVVTTAPGHRAGTVRVGGRAPRGRTSVAGLRRAPNGVFALVRGGRVVALAAGDLASRRDLKAFARRVRLAAG